MYINIKNDQACWFSSTTTRICHLMLERPVCVYIFAFGVYNFKQVNVSGIKIFLAQLLALNLRKVMLNAANIYPFGFIRTKCKYIYRSFINVFFCDMELFKLKHLGFELASTNSTYMISRRQGLSLSRTSSAGGVSKLLYSCTVVLLYCCTDVVQTVVLMLFTIFAGCIELQDSSFELNRSYYLKGQFTGQWTFG